MNWKGLKIKNMRIVSQNGKYDVPYEHFVFISEQNMIYAVSIAGSGTKQWLMAEYTKSGGMQKAMEMLHHEYTSIMPSLVINNGNNFDAESMEGLKNSTVGAFIKPANPGDVEVHMLPRIFRFPDDDEIEVKT